MPGIFKIFAGGFTAIWLALIVGWIANLWQVIVAPGSIGEASTWTVMFAVKFISIFIAPLGGVMGWIGFFV